jgi:hypothetical protein
LKKQFSGLHEYAIENDPLSNKNAQPAMKEHMNQNKCFILDAIETVDTSAAV